jgi:hypothetical protein
MKKRLKSRSKLQPTQSELPENIIPLIPRSFPVGSYKTRHESQFACNVASLIANGPHAGLFQGVRLTLERKKQIEAEVLDRIRRHLNLPNEFRFGRLPRLYAEESNSQQQTNNFPGSKPE